MYVLAFNYSGGVKNDSAFCWGGSLSRKQTYPWWYNHNSLHTIFLSSNFKCSCACVLPKKSVSHGPRIRPSKRDRIGNWFFEKPYIPCLIWKEISIVEIRKTQEDLVEWRNLQRNPRQTEWLFLDSRTKKDSQVMQIIAWSGDLFWQLVTLFTPFKVNIIFQESL